MTSLNDFDHPCKNRCSGWQQGFDRGAESMSGVSKQRIRFAEEISALKSIIAKELSENDEFGSEFVMVTILKDNAQRDLKDIQELKKIIKEMSDHSKGYGHCGMDMFAHTKWRKFADEI